ncbi:MAG TPA: hypothetical protein VLU46_12280 [Thermoanaerobaculia bacterium]|nr:hypothetical protein [Thermoanaerobaculia bacterium]
MQLSLITLGHVHEQDINALTAYCTRLEQLVLDVQPRASLSQHRAEFNRAVDAATNDWIVIVRERETIDGALAKEIVENAAEGGGATPKAWGFRIRTVPVYAGKPLRVETESEVRLFHRRHYIRFAEEFAIQGTIVRLQNAFRAVTFDSAEAHRAYLEKNAVPHSTLRRVLLFLKYARTLDRNTLRYIWTEAGFDKG